MRGHGRQGAGAFALALALAGGCKDEELEALSCRSDRTVYDPFMHDVCMMNCYDALDCPRGTICAKSDEASGSCTVPKDALQTSRAALLDGFGVGEMVASLRTDGALELAWERPAGARFVNCVLLACPPAFRVPLPSGGWARPEDPSLVQIANYDRCVLASDLSSQAEGSLNLRERDNEYTVSGPLAGLVSKANAEKCKGYGCAPITELLAGCWAYDDTRIVAATRLFAIDIGETPPFNYKHAFAPDGICRAKDEDQFRACSLAEPLPAASADTTGGAGTGVGATTGGETGETGDTDTGGEQASPSEAPRYGVCFCSIKDGTGVCADPSPCKAPCTSDNDCDPANAMDNLSGSIAAGYCEPATKRCVAFP